MFEFCITGGSGTLIDYGLIKSTHPEMQPFHVEGPLFHVTMYPNGAVTGKYGKYTLSVMVADEDCETGE